MAKLSADEQMAITAGYDEGERLARTLRPCQYVNPHPWSSRRCNAPLLERAIRQHME